MQDAPELHERYADRVVRVGELLGQHGASMISGHCPGIPELAEEAFKRSRISARRQPLIGVRIILRQPDGSIFEETDPNKVDIYIETPLFGARIEVMEAMADGAIFPPGGIGTRLELFLFIQKLQLGHYIGRQIPLVLLGSDHWRPVLTDFRQMVKDGTLNKKEFYVKVTDDPEEAVELVLGSNGNAARAARARISGSRIIRAVRIRNSGSRIIRAVRVNATRALAAGSRIIRAA
ncbi:LOG family protein [Patescibacteria group bacterium]